ncbi:MAG: DUF2764 family protein [Simkaniaceae bacterium]|nr:DUF2764 family protein [Simkaniaceae bacterium]
MTKYFYLGASMPALRFGEMPLVTFEALVHAYGLNLKKSDWSEFSKWREALDIENLKKLWLDESIDRRGNLDKEDLEERIITMSELPQVALDFLHNFDGDDRTAHFPELLSNYLKEMGKSEGFIGEYFRFEKQLKLVLAAYRAKRDSADLMKVLMFEDLSDHLVQQLFAQKDVAHFEMPTEFTELGDLLRLASDDPIKQHLAVMQYRFEWCAEKIQERQFSIDWLIGYAIMLKQCEESLVA